MSDIGIFVSVALVFSVWAILLSAAALTILFPSHRDPLADAHRDWVLKRIALEREIRRVCGVKNHAR